MTWFRDCFSFKVIQSWTSVIWINWLNFVFLAQAALQKCHWNKNLNHFLLVPLILQLKPAGTQMYPNNWQGWSFSELTAAFASVFMFLSSTGKTMQNKNIRKTFLKIMQSNLTRWVYKKNKQIMAYHSFDRQLFPENSARVTHNTWKILPK